MLDPKKCKAMLEKRGMSQSELARRTGDRRENVCCYMNGKRNIIDRKLKKICHELDCTAEELW